MISEESGSGEPCEDSGSGCDVNLDSGSGSGKKPSSSVDVVKFEVYYQSAKLNNKISASKSMLLKTEGIIVPLLLRFSKPNFTYLGKLRLPNNIVYSGAEVDECRTITLPE